MAQIDAVAGSSKSFIPVIDMAPYLAGTPEGKRQVATQLDRACREVGFYIIVGHGVDPSLIEQVDAVSRAFFDLPLDEKMKVHIGKRTWRRSAMPPLAISRWPIPVVRSRRPISTSCSRSRKST